MDAASNSAPAVERRFTVQLGYPTWFAITVAVDAESIAQACERAVEDANLADAWRSLDDCGATFVERLAEGDDVNLWCPATHALPVPIDYAEHLEVLRLRGILGNLLDWAAMTGGFDAEIWRTAERALGRSAT